jgi:hypothetical protein
MPSARSAIDRPQDTLAARAHMDVGMNDRSILISSGVMSASADNDE